MPLGGTQCTVYEITLQHLHISFDDFIISLNYRIFETWMKSCLMSIAISAEMIDAVVDDKGTLNFE